MKKFLYKLFAYAFILSCIILFLNYFYIAYTIGDETTQKFLEMPEKIQICNFGSSHGEKGFNYENANNKFSCFNFGLSSQSLNYDYKLLMYYIDHIQENGIVFIIVSYFSFFGKEETDEEDFASKNRRYYKILPENLIEQFDPTTNFYIKYFPLLIADKKLITIFINRTTAADLGDVEETGRKRYLFHMEANKFDKDEKVIADENKINTLYKMINLCFEKNLVPILVTTPYLTEYSKHFRENEDFISKFYAVINKIVSDTGVRYYDYSTDERFSHEYKLFRDTDHLNQDGALKFTGIIINDTMKDLKQQSNSRNAYE